MKKFEVCFGLEIKLATKTLGLDLVKFKTKLNSIKFENNTP